MNPVNVIDQPTNQGGGWTNGAFYKHTVAIVNIQPLHLKRRYSDVSRIMKIYDKKAKNIYLLHTNTSYIFFVDFMFHSTDKEVIQSKI